MAKVTLMAGNQQELTAAFEKALPRVRSYICGYFRRLDCDVDRLLVEAIENLWYICWRKLKLNQPIVASLRTICRNVHIGSVTGADNATVTNPMGGWRRTIRPGRNDSRVLVNMAARKESQTLKLDLRNAMRELRPKHRRILRMRLAGYSFEYIQAKLHINHRVTYQAQAELAALLHDYA